MDTQKKSFIITFESVHHTMFAENKLKSSCFDIETIPTPREISESCGLSIKFNQITIQEIYEVIETSEIQAAGLYLYEKMENGTKLIRKIE